MATTNADDLKPVTLPLDLSLKIGNISKPIKANDLSDINNFHDHKSVSSEELISLKLLHERLSKTMELLLPLESHNATDSKSAQFDPSTSPKLPPDFDYRKTMKTLLSLVESENNQSNDEDLKNMPGCFLSKAPVNHTDAWSYWHDYILSLYLMNSTIPSTILPPPPPPQIPAPASIASALFPPPFNYLPNSPYSMIFHNMLHSIVNRPSGKLSSKETCSKPFPQENHTNRDFGFKTKKLNSYQFLKDSNSLYSSFAANRNLGLGKSKLLDSPESFGVSLRGNQKYSIYYQQRPNNIFNNNFTTQSCSSTVNTKSTHTSSTKHSNNRLYHEEPVKKTHAHVDSNHRKSISFQTDAKTQKNNDRNVSTPITSKIQQEKINKFQNFEHGNFSTACNNIGFDNIPPSLNLNSRYKETVFNCSCGQEFENLYSFTIHMKSTHHSPNSSKIERAIPKLVRGQDMWINSETEQTKEILRCMRCQQSFRTLPELTMHMVETNHYSEIVYSDTGKCVFLNSDGDKTRPCYTNISSPISSPGGLIRKLKRPLSNSTMSDICAEENREKRLKTASPFEVSKEFSVKEEISDSEKISENNFSSEEISSNELTLKKEVILEVTEADSETVDPQSEAVKIYDGKKPSDEGITAFSSVIRQIENFVEKSLPKTSHIEYNVTPPAVSTLSSNHRTGKASNKCTSAKVSTLEKLWKNEPKHSANDKSESLSLNKEKLVEPSNSFKYKTYQPVTSSENLESPLSSLQSLVETIQKNTCLAKDQGSTNQKVCSTQTKDTNSYSYPSKSPVVCDSLSQLQALVAGTSTSISTSKPNGQKSLNNFPEDRNKIMDSSATFVSWCHRLGELLGLPQALSQAMLTQDAIKDLANSVLSMTDTNNQSAMERNKTNNDTNNIANNDKDTTYSCPTSSSTTDLKSFQTDPIEQLKILLNTTSEVSQSNPAQTMSNKLMTSLNPHPNSPPTISKKAKCHFCNKPFANKGQVRLHISKGKCPSLLRSCHSSGAPTVEVPTNGGPSSINYDGAGQCVYRGNEQAACDLTPEKGEPEPGINKSANLIREYFKFAKQMIENDAARGSSPTKDNLGHE